MRLSVQATLKESYIYCQENLKVFSIFAFVNYLCMLLIGFAGGWKSPFFLPILIVAYSLWVVFFRFYFNKKPLFNFKATTSSLAPSSKILLLMFVFGTILIFLPYVLVLMGLPINFLEKYMENSSVVDIFLNVLFLFVSPQILYRPYFAWIGSVIERNKSIRFAFDHTTGNYVPILLIVLIINTLMWVVSLILPWMWVEYFFISIIFTYFNVVLARSYDFFFKV